VATAGRCSGRREQGERCGHRVQRSGFPSDPRGLVTRPDPAEHCSLQHFGRPRWVATRALPHGGPQRGRQRGLGCSRVLSVCRRKQRASAGGPPRCAAIRSEWPPHGPFFVEQRRPTSSTPSGDQRRTEPRDRPTLSPRSAHAEPRDQPAAHSRLIPATPQRCGSPLRLQRQAAPHHALKRDQRRVSLLAQRRQRARARGSGAGAGWAYGHVERSGLRRVLQGAPDVRLDEKSDCSSASPHALWHSALSVAPVLQGGRAAAATYRLM